MGNTKKNLVANILGVTKSGKYIYVDPTQNTGFKKQDHIDAYKAHASILMYNVQEENIQKHRQAMNEHYLRAVQNS